MDSIECQEDLQYQLGEKKEKKGKYFWFVTERMLVGKNTSKNNSENKEKIYFYIDQEHFKLKGWTPLNVKKTSNINLEKEKKREIFLVCD